jgi:hypothetical protein
MRRVGTFLGTAAIVMMATSVFAQAPDFSGTWTVDAEKTAAMAPAGAAAGGGGGGGGRGGGRGGGGPVTLKQDAKVLTITRTMGENQVVTTYNLDGSPSKNAGRGAGGATEVSSTAKWDGAKLVVTSDNGQTVTYSMDGAWLVQTTTRPGQDGGPARTTAVYYKKG